MSWYPGEQGQAGAVGQAVALLQLPEGLAVAGGQGVVHLHLHVGVLQGLNLQVHIHFPPGDLPLEVRFQLVFQKSVAPGDPEAALEIFVIDGLDLKDHVPAAYHGFLAAVSCHAFQRKSPSLRARSRRVLWQRPFPSPRREALLP